MISIDNAIFVVVVIFLISKIVKSINKPVGDWGVNLEPAVCIVILLIFTAIWGGIFWW